jgi:hypothetical protein
MKAVLNALAGRWLTLLFLVLAGLMLWQSFGLSRVSGWIPRSVLLATCLLLVAQGVLDLRRATSGSRVPEAAGGQARVGRERAAVAWIVALLGAAWLLGVIGGSALFCLAWMRWHAGERWPAALALAVGVAATLWLVFGRLPGPGLYSGLVGGLIA